MTKFQLQSMFGTDRHDAQKWEMYPKKLLDINILKHFTRLNYKKVKIEIQTSMRNLHANVKIICIWMSKTQLLI